MIAAGALGICLWKISAAPMPELIVHLRSDTLVAVDAGGFVASWGDASGHGHSFRQDNAASRPYLHRAGSPDGKPSIAFDGVSDFLRNDESILLHDSATFLIIAQDSEPDRSTILLEKGMGDIGVHLWYGLGKNYDLCRSWEHTIASTSFQTSKWAIYNARWSGTKGDIWVSGLATGSGLGDNGAWTNNPTLVLGAGYLQGDMSLGSQADFFFHGQVSEVRIYHGYLDDAQRKSLEDSLLRSRKLERLGGVPPVDTPVVVPPPLDTPVVVPPPADTPIVVPPTGIDTSWVRSSRYLDIDGDGAIDAWSATVNAPPWAGTVYHLPDPDGTGRIAAVQSRTGDTSLTRVYPLPSPWKVGTTSLRGGSGDVGRALFGLDSTPFVIDDGAPPVAMSSEILFGSFDDPDTVVVVLSEGVFPGPRGLYFLWSTDSSGAVDDSSLTMRRLEPVGDTVRFLVPRGRDDDRRPVVGDWLRIAEKGGKDGLGNIAGAGSRWVRIGGAPRPFPMDVFLESPMQGGEPGGPVFETFARRSSVRSVVIPPSVHGDKPGTIVWLRTNRPARVHLWVLDRLGTFVAEMEMSLDSSKLGELRKDLMLPGGYRSNEAIEIGFHWGGTYMDGKSVGDGVYIVRIFASALRMDDEPMPVQVINELFKVGMWSRMP